MARPRSKHFPDIQRSILNRAAAVFARSGYASSTINDITAATELSRGALYHYFPSKEAILREILNDHLLDFRDLLDQAMRSSHDPTEQLRAVTRAIVACNTRSRNEQVLVLNELNQLAEADRETMKDIERQILDRLAALLTGVDVGGVITAVNRRIYTMMYLGIINYSFAWYDPEGPVKPREYADMATDLFLHGLLHGAPARGQGDAPVGPERLSRAATGKR